MNYNAGDRSDGAECCEGVLAAGVRGGGEPAGEGERGGAGDVRDGVQGVPAEGPAAAVRGEEDQPVAGAGGLPDHGAAGDLSSAEPLAPERDPLPGDHELEAWTQKRARGTASSGRR